MTYKLYNPLLEKIEGTVVCVIDGNKTSFSSIHELLDTSFEKKYRVSGISARDGAIVVSLEEDTTIPNDLTSEWAQEYIKETGKEISFF